MASQDSQGHKDQDVVEHTSKKQKIGDGEPLSKTIVETPIEQEDDGPDMSKTQLERLGEGDYFEDEDEIRIKEAVERLK